MSETRVPSDERKLGELEQQVLDAALRGEALRGVVSRRTRGGLLVTLENGLEAFLPGSQCGLPGQKVELDALIEQPLDLALIKIGNHHYDPYERTWKRLGGAWARPSVSRRTFLEGERRARKEETIASLSEGKLVEGVVKQVLDYGAFIDIGGIDGLLHISDMGSPRPDHPSEIVRPGQTVQVVVTKLDAAAERVSLGLPGA